MSEGRKDICQKICNELLFCSDLQFWKGERYLFFSKERNFLWGHQFIRSRQWNRMNPPRVLSLSNEQHFYSLSYVSLISPVAGDMMSLCSWGRDCLCILVCCTLKNHIVCNNFGSSNKFWNTAIVNKPRYCWKNYS